MSDEKFLKRLASFLISRKNPQVERKVRRAGYRISSVYKLSEEILMGFGYKPDEIKSIQKDYNNISYEEIEKGRDAGIEILYFKDKRYPALLREIYDFPEFLYITGDVSVLNSHNILAVVGSRRNDIYGRDVLGKIIPSISENIVIASGMAYGIDSIAHKLILKNGGKTIGVNAGGLLYLYPKGNSNLFSQIKENGCIISEFPLSVEPRPYFFPIRNRIISGISKAVLVVQARMKSGSMITSRTAIEQNRDVFAIPGNIYSPLSEGPNYLIKQGAKLIESGGDILEEFGIKTKIAHPLSIDLNESEKSILKLFEDENIITIDYLAENSNFDVSKIIAILMGLILKNVIIEYEDGYGKIKNG